MKMMSLGWLATATAFWLVPQLLSAGTEEPDCRLTLEVKNCSGEAISSVTVEVEVLGERLRAVTDEAGRVLFEACVDTLGDEVWIYLFEDAAPVSNSPTFEEDPASPGQSSASVLVC